MSSVLEFDGVAKGPRPVLRGDDVGEFWLDVARPASDEPLAAEPAHAPGQVLTEAFLVLATAGLLAAIVATFLPGPAF